MIYTINETNLKRQHLLAQFLAPLSLNALGTISLPDHANILDIGCGLGDTTLMLDKRFPNSTITGLDADASLIGAAMEEKQILHPNLHFVSADAMQLPFEDNCFDFVFTRYCLHHLPAAMDGIKEMNRVCKTGGIVFAIEPDANFLQSYPESSAYPLLKEIVNKLFADAQIGRKMMHYFREAGLKNIEYNIQTILADHTMVLKTFYRMTAEAMSQSVLQRELMTKEQLAAWIKELATIERNEHAIVLTHPVIAVWGRKN